MALRQTTDNRKTDSGADKASRQFFPRAAFRPAIFHSFSAGIHLPFSCPGFSARLSLLSASLSAACPLCQWEPLTQCTMLSTCLGLFPPHIISVLRKPSGKARPQRSKQLGMPSSAGLPILPPVPATGNPPQISCRFSSMIRSANDV